MTTLFSFVSGALASSRHFCYSAVASSSIVLILPVRLRSFYNAYYSLIPLQGFIVLCGALELMSRNIVAGSVRLCYAVVYAIFLGFGLAVGSKAFEKVSGNPVFGPEDYSCSMTHHADGPWYQKTPSKFWGMYLCKSGDIFDCITAYSISDRPYVLIILESKATGTVQSKRDGKSFLDTR